MLGFCLAGRWQSDVASSQCSTLESGDKGLGSGPFARAATDLIEHGLAVIPCGGEDGKVPLVKWRGWKKPPGRDFLLKLAQRHGSANVGILTGLSRVTVVDCDAPGAVAAMIARCGETPLRTRTPSGGTHLWYRSAGERCSNLRAEGLEVDVKGIGGFVVVPPSIRPSGKYAGRSYQLIEGCWSDLARLPTIKSGSSLRRSILTSTDCGLALRAVRRGQRNNMLFRGLLRQAPHCDDFDALLDCARSIAEQCFVDDPNDPFTDAEIREVATSAWRHEQEGRNWVGREARVYTTKSEFDALAAHERGPDGLLLLTKLRLAHWDRTDFTISPRSMQRGSVIPGWAHGRYRKARDALIDTGILQMLNEGGRGAKDTCLCAFAKPPIVKGLEAGHNITEHPSSLAHLDRDTR